jgi:Protein of unknown function (DUF2867)
MEREHPVRDNKVFEVAVIPDTLAILPGADFADAYARSSSSNQPAFAIAQGIFGAQPRWIAGLMALRNVVVRPFGLIRDSAQFPEGAEHIGLFLLQSKTEKQAVFGMNDRHLDFRVLVNVEDAGKGQHVVLTTLVRTHNWPGRLYLFIVKPFHRAIVKSFLRNARLGQEA